MKSVSVWLVTSILAVVFAATTGAQEVRDLRSSGERKTLTVELSPADKLTDEGWERALSGAYQKTFEDGVVVEIAHGELARRHALEIIDGNIEKLQALKERDIVQEARLLELFIERDALTAETSAETNKNQTLCTGTASFDYFTDQDFAYVYADAQTTFIRWMQGATALSETWVYLNGMPDYGWSSGTGLVVSSWAGWSMPTWTCSGSFHGRVTLSGVSCSGSVSATFFAPLYC